MDLLPGGAEQQLQTVLKGEEVPKDISTGLKWGSLSLLPPQYVLSSLTSPPILQWQAR